MRRNQPQASARAPWPPRPSPPDRTASSRPPLSQDLLDFREIAAGSGASGPSWVRRAPFGTRVTSSILPDEPAPPARRAKRRGQEPAEEPQARRAWRDTGTTTENPDDWTNFDIGRTVRLFRIGNEVAHRHTLRKLHVRWHHATAEQMRRFLDRVGVKDEVLDLIPEIVDTCRVCRTWAKPGPANVCSINIPDKINEQVEFDLLFIHKYIIFHLLDRCTRWHAAKTVPNREEGTLTEALDALWTSHHGPIRKSCAS